MNLTAEQTKQALQCLAICGECKESSCEYYTESNDVYMCDNISIAKDTLDYINRLEAENSRLQAQIEALQMENKQLQSDIILVNKDYEHIKELVER